MAAGGHFGCSKITFDCISSHFRSISHFGCPKFTFDRISGHFRSILNFYFFGIFLQNGRRRPFWISEINFWSHFWPFQIDMQLYFLEISHKMAAVGHFGCPKCTFDRISGHFRSILNLFFLEIFDKMAAVGHIGCSKFTFDRISGHFRSIRYLYFFGNFFTKWPPAEITFDCIFSHFRSIGHFGCLKFTFDSNSGHLRSIQNFFFSAAILMSENHFRSHFWQFLIDRPYWMSKIHFRWHFWPFQIHTDLNYFFKFWTKWPQIWMSENNFRSQFLPFQIDTQLFFLIFGQNGRRRSFWIGRQCHLSNSSEIFGWIMHVSSLKNVV